MEIHDLIPYLGKKIYYENTKVDLNGIDLENNLVKISSTWELFSEKIKPKLDIKDDNQLDLFKN
jgi:hypothetical protein